MARTLSKVTIKGSAEYRVTEGDRLIARAHCVHVGMNKYTLVVGGVWAGIGSEEEIVARLRAIAKEALIMSTENHTKPSSLRIPDDIKTAAQKRAAAEGKTLTEVVVAYLRRYGAPYRDS